MKEGKLGSLTVHLQIDSHRVQGVHLKIPMLGIDEHIPKVSQFDGIPAGNYEAIFTAFLTTGEQIKKSNRILIENGKKTLHTFQLPNIPQEVILRPVDANDRTIVAAEIKVDGIDLNFRPVRNWKGINYQLAPGEYRVKIILPTMEVTTLPLKVTADAREYILRIKEFSKTRRETRMPLSVPIDYRTDDGFWVSTETINLSPSGVCLVNKRPGFDERDLYVRLFVPISVGPLECPARVCWTKELGEAPKMGLQLFLTTAIKQSLGRWLSAP